MPGTAGSRRLRIVVLGYIVRGPLGGLCWHHLQYVMGLHALGHDVLFIEDSDDYEACYDPSTDVVGTDPTYGLRFAGHAFDGVGLSGIWAYWDNHQGTWLGPAASRAVEHFRTADLVLNLSGVNPVREWVAGVPRRAFVDTDPVFTQVRHLTEEPYRRLAEAHTSFHTFGENIGRAGCSVPDDGFAWRPTRQPVVLSAWPVTPGPADARYTTVMQWSSYPPLVYGGRQFGMKSESFEPFETMPGLSGRPLELALGTRTAPREKLAGLGWTLVDSREPTVDPWTYQRYIQGSKAEFSIAKHGYVVCSSGWFSERTAAYLASGRPVIVQHTGFRTWLDTEDGVFSFSTPDEAVACFDRLEADYARHCRGARAAAEEYFDARTVLPPLLDDAMSA